MRSSLRSASRATVIASLLLLLLLNVSNELFDALLADERGDDGHLRNKHNESVTRSTARRKEPPIKIPDITIEIPTSASRSPATTRSPIPPALSPSVAATSSISSSRSAAPPASHSGSTAATPLLSQPPPPSPPASININAAREDRILILTEPNYGRFSNNKLSVIEAMGLAAHTGRRLMFPTFNECDKGPSTIFDLAAMSNASGIRVSEDNGADLRSVCGETGTYVWYSSITRDMVKAPEGRRGKRTWRGVTWDVRESQTLDYNASAVPAETRVFLAGEHPLHTAPPFSTHFLERLRAIDMPQFMTDRAFHERIAGLRDTCVIVQVLYLNLNWPALAPGTFERVVSTFQPSARVEKEVSAWFAANNITPFMAVAVHLRMGDIATGFDHGFGHNCLVHGAGFVIDTLRALQKRVGAMHVPLMIASNDFSASCVVEIMAAFNGTQHVRVEGGGRVSNCEETVFLQEVLARSAGFVGNSYSTFTHAVDWIRRERFYLPANTSQFPTGDESIRKL